MNQRIEQINQANQTDRIDPNNRAGGPHIDPLTRELGLFALPMLLGNVLQSGYGMADMAVVGRFVGREALAALSNTTMICFIWGALCMGFALGGNVLVAQCRGAGEHGRLRGVVRAQLALAAAGGLLLTAACYLLYRPLLRLMRVPPEAMPQAEVYMAIASAGYVFVFGYNAAAAIMRGLGDAVRPLYLVAIAAAVNVGLDLLLVGVWEWGVRGAAAATVAAQAAACLAALVLLRRQGVREGLRPSPRRAEGVAADGPGGTTASGPSGAWRAEASAARALLRLGVPSALRAAALNASYLMVTALFNRYGTAAAAAAGIGLKVNTFVAMPCWAVGQAVLTMAGHAAGAGDAAGAGRVARRGIRLALLSTGALLLAIHALVRPLLGIFTADAEVANLGVRYLRICCSLNFAPYAAMFVLDCFATGVGVPLLALANSLLHSIVLRLSLSLLLAGPLGLGFVGLCVAESVSPLIPCGVGLLFLLRGRWRERAGGVSGE